MTSRAVFLDKDGTLIEDVPYNADPDRIRVLPGVVSGLRRLQDAGYRLIVVSNQPGVAQGLFPLEALEKVNHRLQAILSTHGITLDGFYYCPHAASCGCRKPEPGLLFRAASEWNLDLRRSWMIGDILNDVEAGHRAGCHSILVDTGGETGWVVGGFRQPQAIFSCFETAAAWLVRGNLLE